MSKDVKDIIDGLPKGKTMLTTKEVASALGVALRSFEKWRKVKRADGTQKGPRWVDIEGMIRYPRAGVIDYLESRIQDRDANEFVA